MRDAAVIWVVDPQPDHRALIAEAVCNRCPGARLETFAALPTDFSTIPELLLFDVSTDEQEVHRLTRRAVAQRRATTSIPFGDRRRGALPLGTLDKADGPRFFSALQAALDRIAPTESTSAESTAEPTGDPAAESRVDRGWELAADPAARVLSSLAADALRRVDDLSRITALLRDRIGDASLDGRLLQAQSRDLERLAAMLGRLATILPPRTTPRPVVLPLATWLALRAPCWSSGESIRPTGGGELPGGPYATIDPRLFGPLLDHWVAAIGRGLTPVRIATTSTTPDERLRRSHPGLPEGPLARLVIEATDALEPATIPDALRQASIAAARSASAYVRFGAASIELLLPLARGPSEPRDSSRVLVIDSDAAGAAALAAALSDGAAAPVVSQVESLAQLRARCAAGCHYDVALLVLSGDESVDTMLLSGLQEHLPDAQVIVVATDPTAAPARRLIDRGALGAWRAPYTGARFSALLRSLLAPLP